MAPPAPEPVYNSNGLLMVDWTIVARYHTSQDALSLSWSQPGTVHRSPKQGAIAYLPSELADLIEGFSSTVQLLGQPRLF